MRFTAVQRRVEMGEKCHRQFRKELLDLDCDIREEEDANQSILTLQKELASCSHKSTCLDNFIGYLQKRREVSAALDAFYRIDVHRNMRLSKYTRTQRSEARLVKNFKKTSATTCALCSVTGPTAAGHRNFRNQQKEQGGSTCL